MLNNQENKENSMNELIKIERRKIGNEEINAVSARDLHKFLGVGKDFSTWLKNRIGEYNFVENTDFIVFPKIGENLPSGRPLIEYYVSIDMAKELCMVEKNDKGKEARKYFIECEKKLKSLMITPKDYPSALRALADEVEAKEKLAKELEEAKPKIEFCDYVTKHADSVRVGDYAKILSDSTGIVIGPNKLFKLLREKGYLMIGRDDLERNKPYQSAIDAGLFEFKIERPKPHILVCVPYVTGRGQFELKSMILEYFNNM